MKNLTLGKAVAYPDRYDPALLQPVARSINREEIKISGDALPFCGVDIWNAYEVSWLTPKHKPQIAILECRVPVSSPNIIESKSFKLYLNSLNQTVFACTESLIDTITNDLSRCANAGVTVSLFTPERFDAFQVKTLEGIVLDDIDATFDFAPQIQTEALTTAKSDVTETLVSHLLKSNCLITNQPDWGSVLIRYQGKQIDRAGLLKYIVSFRQHNEFHEQCVERIFTDIMTHCNPDKLTVYARYTRRGGLDINPFRSNFEQPYENLRLARQ
ncbi:MAG: NADPH-dependent 7-cyano-7-deazaguanine reductase QueF [Pseudomonadota bacterium]